MRFSATAVLALPLLAAAAESPFAQYKAKFQNFLSSFGASAPSTADKVEPVAAPAKAKAKKVGPKKIESLTLHGWNETLFAPVKPGATSPEEWWVLITGGNKTCFGATPITPHNIDAPTLLTSILMTGRCLELEKAFNESAVKLATVPKSPHLARLDCETEPILCNSWSASAGAVWAFEMLPSPAPINVYWKPLNLSSTSTKDIMELNNKPIPESFRIIDSYFHPYNGVLHQYGLAIPLAYLIWGLNVLPSWAMMLIISFFSRSFM